MGETTETLVRTGFQGFSGKILEMSTRQRFQGFLSLLPNNSTSQFSISV